MALYPNPQSELLREPNLLIPGKKPVGGVAVDWSNTLLTNNLRFCLGFSGQYDLVTGARVTVNGACSYTRGRGWYFPGATTAYISDCGDWDQSSDFSVIAVITPMEFDSFMVIAARGDSSANEWLLDIRNSGGTSTFPMGVRAYADQGIVNALGADDSVQVNEQSVVGATFGYNSGAGGKTFYNGSINGTDVTGGFTTIAGKSITMGGSDETVNRRYKGWIHALFGYDDVIPDLVHQELGKDPYQFMIPA